MRDECSAAARSRLASYRGHFHDSLRSLIALARQEGETGERRGQAQFFARELRRLYDEAIGFERRSP
jgi:hypothetical protein